MFQEAYVVISRVKPSDPLVGHKASACHPLPPPALPQLMPRACWLLARVLEGADAGAGAGGESLPWLHQDVDAGEPCFRAGGPVCSSARGTRAPPGPCSVPGATGDWKEPGAQPSSVLLP